MSSFEPGAEESPALSSAAMDPAIILEPAGFWIRAGARALDWIVQALIGGVAGILLALIAVIAESAGGRPAAVMLASLERMTFIGWIGSALTAVVYHAVSEGFSGSTIGKRLLRLQVVGEDLTPITFRQGMTRSVAFLVDALFFGAIGAHAMSESREKQRIGDRWAETRVVRSRSLPSSMRTSTGRLFGAFAAGIAVTFVVIVITQLAEYLWLIRAA